MEGGGKGGHWTMVAIVLFFKLLIKMSIFWVFEGAMFDWFVLQRLQPLRYFCRLDQKML